MIRSQVLLWILLFTDVLSAQQPTPQNLGPHNINGQACLSCHISHVMKPGKDAENHLWGKFSRSSETADSTRAVMAGATNGEQDPSFHSTVCLVCHDGSIATAASLSDSSHLQEHPVHVPYPVGAAGHWPGTVTGDRIVFQESNFDYAYGRSVRFYISAGKAYIECGTCHDQHSYRVTTVKLNGQSYSKPTAHFIRGWYDETNESSNSASQFCRSCHYEMSNERYGAMVSTQ